MTAFIGYDNIFRYNEPEIIIPETDELESHPFANAYSGNMYDSWIPGINGLAGGYVQWSGGSRNADYIAIQGHNLAGKTIELERSGTFGWISVHTFTPSSNDAIFERFDGRLDNFWRILINGCEVDTYITNLYVGTALQLNPLRAPFSPPPKARHVEIVNNESVNNVLLGRVLRDAPFDLRIDQTLVSPDWIEQNSKALIESIDAEPFFFTWDDTKDDACIAWTERPVDAPRYGRLQFQEFTIRAKGYR